MLDVHAVPGQDIELNAEHLDDFDEESCGLEDTPTEVELMVMLSGMVPTGRFG